MIHPIKHFKTITKHRHLVIKYCFYAGVGFQGLRHDLSKYSLHEFLAGAKNYQGICSPNNIEISRKGYSDAWLHHKGRNRHHYEYWTIYSKNVKGYISIKMPIKYVKEMLCDHISATKIYNKKNYRDDMIIDYFYTKNERNGMHPDTADLLETWMKWVKDEGIKKALHRVRYIKTY